MQGFQDLAWVPGLEPSREDAVRFTMAKFGCDPKEGPFSGRPESLESWPFTGVALVAATALWGLFSGSVSITGLDLKKKRAADRENVLPWGR